MPIKSTKLFNFRDSIPREIRVKAGYPEETTGSTTYDNGFPVAHNAIVQVYGNPTNTLPNGVLAPIPARDFMGLGASNWERDWAAQQAGYHFAQSIKTKNPSLYGDAIGFSLVGFLQEAITAGAWEPNSSYTISNKGSSQPLINEGTLRRLLDSIWSVKR